MLTARRRDARYRQPAAVAIVTPVASIVALKTVADGSYTIPPGFQVDPRSLSWLCEVL